MRIGMWIKVTLLVFALSLAAAGQAAAQPAGEDGPYRSPMRAQCEEELDKDAAWRAELKTELRAVVHDEESRAIANNNRHVVLAYGALWVLIVFFVLYMFLRQRRLQAEIERLERDVAKASEEP